MSINSNNSAIPFIDQVILDSYKKAGLLPVEYGIGSDIQWSARAAHGRRTLNRLLNAHSTERFFEYFIQIDILDLVAGTHLYTLDPNILNIVDDGSYIPASNGSEEEQTRGETPVKPLSAFRWNQLSSKGSRGTPVYYYIERNQIGVDGELLMRLWPVPSEAGRIRFRTHRIPGSSDNGGDSPDFKRHWELWAVYALAAELMVDSSMPPDEVVLMERRRDVAFERLKSYDSNNLGPDVVFVHATPWSGRTL